jgi:quercetin dioxygenase-like cupin family protein
MAGSSWIGTFRAGMAEEPFAGIVRRSFDSERATVTSYRFEPGARFPLHHHPEEQITLVEEGEIELTLGGEVRRLVPGDWAISAPEVVHGIVAGEAGARVLAIVIPRRRGSDGYVIVEEHS